MAVRSIVEGVLGLMREEDLTVCDLFAGSISYVGAKELRSLSILNWFTSAFLPNYGLNLRCAESSFFSISSIICERPAGSPSPLAMFDGTVSVEPNP